MGDQELFGKGSAKETGNSVRKFHFKSDRPQACMNLHVCVVKVRQPHRCTNSNCKVKEVTTCILVREVNMHYFIRW